MMAVALAKEGIELTHIIGPQDRPPYHPAAKAEINRRIDSIVAMGRDPMPLKVRFTTWTLRYNRCSGSRSMGWKAIGSGRAWMPNLDLGARQPSN